MTRISGGQWTWYWPRLAKNEEYELTVWLKSWALPLNVYFHRDKEDTMWEIRVLCVILQYYGTRT